MNKLLKSDFYKLAKGKSFWICLLLAALLPIVMTSMQNFTYQMVAEMEGVAAEMPTVVSSLKDSISNNMVLFGAIMISIFIGAEFGYGTIKNTASRGFSRTNIYLSKLIVSFVISAAVLFVSVFAYFASAACFWKFGEAPAGFWEDFAKTVGLAFLISLAYASLFVMLTTLLRQSGGAIAINICTMTFGPTFVQLGDMFVQHFFHWDVTFSDYLLGSNLVALSRSGFIPNEIAIRALIVSAAFLVVTTAFGLFAFQKRDIK